MLCGSRLLLLDVCIHGPALNSHSRLRICDRQWGKQRMRMNRSSPRGRICAAFCVQEIAQIAESAALDSPIELSPTQLEIQSPVKVALLMAVTAFFFYSSYKERIKALRKPKKIIELEGEELEAYLKDYERRALAGRWEAPRVDAPKEATPFGDAVSALLASGISWVVYECALELDSRFADQRLPNWEWQIGNGSITIRAIVVGAMWLVSGGFGGTCLGMVVAVVERLIKGELEESEAESEEKPSALLTSSSTQEEIASATQVSSEK